MRNRQSMACRRVILRLEELEHRLAPATLVNATTLMFTDTDGDTALVTLSQPVLTASNGASIFTFNNPFATGGPQQLETIDLTQLTTPPAGLSLLISSTPGAGGRNGFVNVGFINATGIDLGTVVVRGDLGRIDAGNSATPTTGLGTLIVQSLGRLGISTQAPGGSLESDIQGRLGALFVHSDIDGAFIQTQGGTKGAIGTAIVGGSLLGGHGIHSGSIISSGDMGPVYVGGSLRGGAGRDSGEISSLGKLAGVTVVGSLLGGDGVGSGQIASSGMLGAVRIGGDVRGGLGDESAEILSGLGIPYAPAQFFSTAGISAVTVGGSVVGGAGYFSAEVVSTGNIGPIKIAGDVKGGDGLASAQILSSGTIGPVEIGRNLIGGSGNGEIGNGAMGWFSTVTGGIFSGGDLAGVTIGGSVVGGPGSDSGEICSVTNAGPVKIGGDLRGGPASASGGITTFRGGLAGLVVGGSILGGTGPDSALIVGYGNLGGVTIGGSLVGGALDHSGEIRFDGSIGLVRIAGDLRGGDGSESGAIVARGKLAGVTLGGSVAGGAGFVSGMITCSGDLGSVIIAGDVRGGAGSGSGQINGWNVVAVTLGGSLLGGPVTGTGLIYASNGILGPVAILGNVVGGSIAGAASLDASGYIHGDHVVSIHIGGSLISGTNNSTGTLTHSGSIRADHDLGPITIDGDIIGNSTNPVVISATGQAVVAPGAKIDLAIAGLSVGGRVKYANILAGYDAELHAMNGRASIGTVTVGKDWIASNLVAGVMAGNDKLFGTADDTEIGGTETTEDLVAAIASIIIKGQVLGTPSSVNSSDHFGFVAEQIGSLSVGGVTAMLRAGPSNDLLSLGATGDVTLLEVP